jgi:HSP20 family molecular chaperone IbpA
VKISRQKLTESDIGFYHREERLFAERRRCIKLPENADCDHAVAALSNGILTVTLPKSTCAKKMIPFLKG